MRTKTRTQEERCASKNWIAVETVVLDDRETLQNEIEKVKWMEKTGATPTPMYSMHYDNGVDDKGHHPAPNSQSAHVDSGHNATVDCNRWNGCRDSAEDHGQTMLVIEHKPKKKIFPYPWCASPVPHSSTYSLNNMRTGKSTERWKRWVREWEFLFDFFLKINMQNAIYYMFECIE